MGSYYSDMVHRQTCVYRLYDFAGRLLYVGLTLRVQDRVTAHRRKPWGSLIARVETEWFTGRVAAKEAERAAIQSEGPIHNIVRPREGAR